jgi:radical SAM protein with 4Fe4S-binding SPASM domain
MRHETQQYNRAKNLKKIIDTEDPFPQIIEIHPSYACNNNCNYCFHKNNKIKSGDITLEFKHYKAIIKDMWLLGIFNLSISGGGEPTLYKELPLLIKEANKNLIKVRIVTNGNLVSDEFIESLKLVEEIRLSVDAISAEVYSKVRNVPRNRFIKTIDNIQKIITYKKSNGLSIKVGVTFLINQDNYHETKMFCEKMLNLGVDSIVIKTDIYGSYTINKDEASKISAEINKLMDDRIEIREMDVVVPELMSCFIPHFKIAINPFGKVYSCCLAAQPGNDNGFELGDIGEKSLGEIWRESRGKRLSAKESGIKCTSCNYTDYKLNKLLSK